MPLPPSEDRKSANLLTLTMRAPSSIDSRPPCCSETVAPRARSRSNIHMIINLSMVVSLCYDVITLLVIRDIQILCCEVRLLSNRASRRMFFQYFLRICNFCAEILVISIEFDLIAIAIFD